MARDYTQWLNIALKQKTKLDRAVALKDERRIILYRGRYLSALKHAHKVLPTGTVPPALTGNGRTMRIEQIIDTELSNHQAQINSAIINNKRNSSIKNTTLSKELGLKIRRLATRYDQINFTSNVAIRNNRKQEMIKDAAGLAGTAVKAPFMAAAKVATIAGPLVIELAFMPTKIFVALLSAIDDISNDRVFDVGIYNNTGIAKLSTSLKDAVKKVSKETYEKVGRI